MNEKNIHGEVKASGTFYKEMDFWKEKLAGKPGISAFPRDYPETGDERTEAPVVSFRLPRPVYGRLVDISHSSSLGIFIILLSGIHYLLYRYSGNEDIVVATPVLAKEAPQSRRNEVVILRNQVQPEMAFKDLLLTVKETLADAVRNIKFYPFAEIVKLLSLPSRNNGGENSPVLSTLVLYKNLQDEKIVGRHHNNTLFSFEDSDGGMAGEIRYNPALFNPDTIRRLSVHLVNYLTAVTGNPNVRLAALDILSGQEKRRLLVDFNNTGSDLYKHKTIAEIFEIQAKKYPQHTAVLGPAREGPPANDIEEITYGELNSRSNSLAHFLRRRGIKPNEIVAIILPRSIDLVVGILAVLKAGGTCFLVDVETPGNRLLAMLEDCRVSFLLVNRQTSLYFSFTQLQIPRSIIVEPYRTAPRPQIDDLDHLPIPDRSLIDYERYDPYIGDPMVKNTYITLQATRGCPFNCAYCHKIWPKSHIFRSADHIFREVSLYYAMGVRRFSFVDDVFNLKAKNSSRFFKMLIDNGLNVQLFFPSGFRGDILSRDYIDLMVEAGTILTGIALETASPRLQKLIGKNLKLDKFRDCAEYFCRQYPNVILEFQTMLGFPTETEEEALLTLNFIKSLKWLHFPYVNILRIYANTDMEKLALENGITRQQILNSEGLAYHELPETLPFDRQFTSRYQSDFMNNYFLSRERLLSLLPHQARVLTRDELVQKYDSYLPADIKSFDDLLRLVNITTEGVGIDKFLDEDHMLVPGLDREIRRHFSPKNPDPDAYRILLLDLSQIFTADGSILYDLAEPPLGLLSLLTYLNEKFGKQINGKIAKSRLDFSDYRELKSLIHDFKPDLIGIRTLTFYKDFFHKTVAVIRQWGIDVPIISGGPYATSNYTEVLQNRGINLVVMGEGEHTFTELVQKILENGGRLPDDEVLEEIAGLAFLPGKEEDRPETSREILVLDELSKELEAEPEKTPESVNGTDDMAFTIFTSGSTGKPKAALLNQVGVVNHVYTKIKELEIDHKDILVQNLNVSFVASIWQFFAPLFSGARFHIVPEYILADPYELFRKAKADGVTVLEVVPSVLKTYLELLESGKEKIDLDRLRLLVLTGEKVNPSLVNQFYQKFRIKLVNAYGQSECSDDTFHYKIPFSADTTSVPIGKPALNTWAYILDHSHQLQPLGVTGELYIGGNGLARGYLNRPESTVERFVKDPFISDRRLYRTGDLVRWLPSGDVEFIGRVDHQVKIRGFRVELGEIESQLMRHPQIKEAVVAANRDEWGSKYLCAYFVPQSPDDRSISMDTFKSSELREYLFRELPDYMVPSFFIPLENIPLTASGKVNRQILPDPRRGVEDKTVTPLDGIEEKVARVWSEVLRMKMESLNKDANFFESGGNSLRAVVFASKLHKELDVDVTLTDIFEAPTVRKLSNFIRGLSRHQYVSIEKVREKEYYSLSSAQKRLYILQQMEPEGVGYNIPMFRVLEGIIDRMRIKETFVHMIERHESLRTSFRIRNHEPVQEIYPEVEFAVDYHDLTSLAEPLAMVRQMVKEFVRPFDLRRAPLLRVGLLKVEEEQHVLMFDMHHIVADGTSQRIFIQEFIECYAGRPLPPLRIQYKDYSEWQNSEVEIAALKKQAEYWLHQFSDRIPVLNLPFDYPRPAVQQFDGTTLRFQLPVEECRRLKQLALDQGCTLYMVLMALFNILLSKLSGQEDIVVGTPVAGRRHADLEKIIGMFVNTLALRHYPVEDRSFVDFLQEVKSRTLAAFENQDYPFEDLVENVGVERDVSRNPLFDVMFALQNMEQADIGSRQATGVTVKPFGHSNVISKFDLSLSIVEAGEDLFLSFEFVNLLFKGKTVERFMNYFRKIIEQALGKRDIRLGDIVIIGNEERKQIINEFNLTETAYSKELTIHEGFRIQADRIPDKIAVLGRELSLGGPNDNVIYLSYRELDNRSREVARILQYYGAKTDGIVAVVLERSHEMMAAILGVLKAGSAFLPIDPDFPEKRIGYMLTDSSTDLLIGQENLMGKYRELKFGGRILPLPVKKPVIPTVIPENSISAASAAYVIYTSGSTGMPKGILIQHRSVMNFIESMAAFIDFHLHKSILALTTISFDIFVLETLLPVNKGLTVVVADENQQRDPALLAALIIRSGVNMLQLTPSTLQLVMNFDADLRCMHWVAELMVGGEYFPPDLFERLKERFSGKIYNMFGPTETTIWSTVRELTHQVFVTIGMPIANTQVYIIDRSRHLLPVGLGGELCIAGDGLSGGYINRPELTARKFTPVPFQPAVTMYHTGDLARWLPDGDIDFLGRVDHQVKIRGYRIELGEIENRLLLHPAIREAVVVSRQDSSGDKYLCAYVVAKETAAVADLDQHSLVSQLRSHLTGELPVYMIPSYFVLLPRIPLTENGKINRRALPEPEISGDMGKYVAPRNKVEARLVEIWADILTLETENIGIDDNFFELGGHSLKATVLISRIRKEFQVEFPFRYLFSEPYIRTSAHYIRNARAVVYDAVQAAEKREYYRLSSAQKRLFYLELLKSGTTGFNLTSVFKISGPVEPQRYERTFLALIDRHESLRTSFRLISHQPVQFIHSQVTFHLEVDDRCGFDIPGIITDFVRPFDLERAPLMRATLSRISEHESLLLFDMHHIVSDGTSMGILMADFTALYHGGNKPVLKVQYKDFAVWQNDKLELGGLVSEQAYWFNEFADAAEIERLRLPYDFPRPDVIKFEAGSHTFKLGAERTRLFKKLISLSQATLYMNLLAVFNILLHKYTGQTDIVIGTGIAGRQHEELQPIIGMFVNQLALRSRLRPDSTYRQLLRKVKTMSIKAFENQNMQFEWLSDHLNLERNTLRNPLFDVGITVQNFEFKRGESGSETGFVPYHIEKRRIDIDINLFIKDLGGDIACFIDYVLELFREETIKQMAVDFLKIVDTVIQNREIRIEDIELMDAAEKEQATAQIRQEREFFNRLAEEDFDETL